MNIGEFRRALEVMPPGSLVPRDGLLDLLEDFDELEPVRAGPEPQARGPESWRTKLWSVPGDTRLGVSEAAEALGRSTSWIYHRTSTKADVRLPHRRLDGSLTFIAGELREWLRDAEELVEPGRVERLKVVGGDRR